MLTRLDQQLRQSRSLHVLEGVEAAVAKALPRSGQQTGRVVQLGPLVEAEVDVLTVQRQVGVVVRELARSDAEPDNALLGPRHLDDLRVYGLRRLVENPSAAAASAHWLRQMTHQHSVLAQLDVAADRLATALQAHAASRSSTEVCPSMPSWCWGRAKPA